jgi:guanylate kinase
MTSKYPVVIISGPSGAGEDSIIAGIEKILPIEKIKTTSTRGMRPGESQGKPYNFISIGEFKDKIKENGFFECAQHYNDEYYGVSWKEIERAIKSGRIPIWKIDYKGVISAKEKLPNCLTILITAPLTILEQRIRQRSGVSDDYVAKRMKYTREWFKNKDIYDYEVENKQNQLNKTIDKVVNIINKELKLDKKSGRQ